MASPVCRSTTILSVIPPAAAPNNEPAITLRTSAKTAIGARLSFRCRRAAVIVSANDQLIRNARKNAIRQGVEQRLKSQDLRAKTYQSQDLARACEQGVNWGRSFLGTFDEFCRAVWAALVDIGRARDACEHAGKLAGFGAKPGAAS